MGRGLGGTGDVREGTVAVDGGAAAGALGVSLWAA